MPIYEYKCDACGKTREYLVRKPDDIPARCPDCGESDMTKQFSTFSAMSNSSAPSCSSGNCELASQCESPCCNTGNCPL